MNNLGFQIRGDSNNPFHLSIGIVVKDSNGKIALVKKDGNYFTIPRETMYSLENIEESARRGAMEELGIEISVDKFIGSLITHFNRPNGTKIEKTTIYFLGTKKGEAKRKPETDEVEDEVVWTDLRDAVSRLRNCKNPEYRILKRVFPQSV